MKIMLVPTKLWLLIFGVSYVHSFLLCPNTCPKQRLSTNQLHVAVPITTTGTNTDIRAGEDEEEASSLVSDDEIEFPPPLTPIERIKRAATFYSTAVPIIASYYGLMTRISLSSSLLSKDEIETLWDQQHQKGARQLAQVVTDLKGFYVKTAQIISTRQDLFPKQYTDALQGFTDSLDPMPARLTKAVIAKELHLPFDQVFEEFDDEPLGSASVAQVHRAKLTQEFGGGKIVAVKVQRPSIESKLMGDIKNLKALAKALRATLPLDYYKVFCELEVQLADEFDFVAECDAMDRIYDTLVQTSPVTGQPTRDIPLVIPRPVHELVTRRVLVMDFLDGLPLTRAREEMEKRGVTPDSPQAKLFGRKLLAALTQTFGRTILETGFFHADPHPGNIMVLKDGNIGLIDFGQHKQISQENRETLAKVMIGIDERWPGEVTPEALELVGKLSLELGVELKPDAPLEAAAAVGVWLFGSPEDDMPGGFDRGELSPNSPVRALQSFPQDLVLVGRSTILIKALSSRLGIPWSLAKEWAPIAREVLKMDNFEEKNAAQISKMGQLMGRLKRKWGVLRQMAKSLFGKAARRLPGPMQRLVASLALKLQERHRKR